MTEINFEKLEKKWQDRWAKAKVFESKEEKGKEKFYVLEMFPYPSGSGLHMGHAWNYTIGDIFSRLKKMQGYNILHPMGYDALGLPAENAAIKEGVHPQDYTKKSTENFMKQQKLLGLSYDWTRVLNTSDPTYYKWDQWIFLKMLEKNLAYQKESDVNWCSKCDTVLANEQVHDGKCWRHEDTKVQIKKLKQWFLKITNYADELYEKLNDLKDWPSKTVSMQKNWIGKSSGLEIDFLLDFKKDPKLNENRGPDGERATIKVFTTRPDTIFGATYLVLSPEHLWVTLATNKSHNILLNKEEVKTYVQGVKNKSDLERQEQKVKTGVELKGVKAINPANGKEIPVFVADYVLPSYGTGAIMAVPAHDQRDLEFAEKYELEIKEVISPVYENNTGSDAYRKNEPKVERNVVVAIIKNPKTKKYLLLKWKKNDWAGFVTGGIEKGEDIVEAAKREILEETGYTDLKFVKKIDGVVHSRFYHELKKQNRVAHFETIFFELKSEKKENISEKESNIHTINWIEENKVSDFISRDNDMLIIWEKFIGGKCYDGHGILTNSKEFDELDNEEAKEKISSWLIKKGLARKKTNFKLKDWGISRQRYWGTPIPIIHCEKCGPVPVPEKDLPVILPEKVKFGKGNPLKTAKEWIKTKCPKCNSNAKRETDTMDTFVNSSWYFLRYCDPKNNKDIFEKNKVSYWCPIDQYIGGSEHACMHLIYFRFYTKFLRDLGLLKFDEPALKLFHQGMLLGEDGQKMSKSKGNVITPESVSKKYGIDTARLFLVMAASPEKNFEWSENGIKGSLKIVKKIIEYFESVKIKSANKKIEEELNKLIQIFTEEIEEFNYRSASIKLHSFFNILSSEKESSLEVLNNFLKMFSIFCPHIAEELYEKLGNKEFVSTSKWPKVKKITEGKIKEQDLTINLQEEIARIKKATNKENAKVYVYIIPSELNLYKKISGVTIFSSSDPKKYDPENKSKKAIPKKPSIYLE